MRKLSRLLFEVLLIGTLLLLARESFAYQSLDGSVGLMNQAIRAERASVPGAKWSGSCASCHTDGISPSKSLSTFGQLLVQPAPTPAFGGAAPTALTEELKTRLRYVIGNDPVSGQAFDSDQDGASNLAEIDAGTDPANASSKPGSSAPVGISPARDQSGLSVGAPQKSMNSTAGCGEKKSAAQADFSHLLLFGFPILIAQGLKRRRKK